MCILDASGRLMSRRRASMFQIEKLSGMAIPLTLKRMRNDS
jgi:hypothetical protein